MKALVWEGPRVMNMHDEAEPTAAKNEVVIKVGYVGICGSELSGYLGHNALRVPPLVMGHEFAGEIVSVGEGVSNLKPGMLVTVNPLASCGECLHCQNGLNQLCLNRRLIGAHRPGANAEYVAAPAVDTFPLPEGMSLRIGALTEPVGVGVRIGELAGSLTGESALIIGAGPIGLLALQMLQNQGAKQVFISDLDEERLAMGEALGGTALNPRAVQVVETVREATNGVGVPVSVDAVGMAVTRSQCVAATLATGKVILSGLHEETSAMPAADIIRREIVVKGSFAYSPANFAAGLQLLAKGAIRLDPWIIEAPLAEGGHWFDRLVDAPGDVAKVLLVP
jgi:threonine dehydrogenase-like Zn-dependent dehydrogenase